MKGGELSPPFYCAAVSFADVSSANVVGYAGVQLNAGGKNMAGAVFVSVGNRDKQMRLSELKITGYEGNEYYLTEECAFVLTFQIRNSNGSPKFTYQWADESDGESTWNGGVWSDTDTGAVISKDNDVFFNAGDALWIQTPDLQGSEAFYLQSSGEVVLGDCGVELNAGGKCAVCNMLPAPTGLSKIEIQGYEENEYYLTEECAFVLTMQSLKSNGQPQATYQWADESDGESTWMGGVWSDTDTGAVINDDNEVTVGAGEGFWLTCPDLQGSTAFYFVVPKVIAK